VTHPNPFSFKQSSSAHLLTYVAYFVVFELRVSDFWLLFLNSTLAIEDPFSPIPPSFFRCHFLTQPRTLLATPTADTRYFPMTFPTMDPCLPLLPPPSPPMGSEIPDGPSLLRWKRGQVEPVCLTNSRLSLYPSFFHFPLYDPSKYTRPFRLAPKVVCLITMSLQTCTPIVSIFSK